MLFWRIPEFLDEKGESSMDETGRVANDARFLIVIIIVVCIAATFFYFHGPRITESHTKIPVCIPTMGATCPPAEFVEAYRQWTELKQRTIADSHAPAVMRYQADQDELNGMTARIRAAIPYGQTFDEPNMRFMPISAPTPPPAPAPKK